MRNTLLMDELDGNSWKQPRAGGSETPLNYECSTGIGLTALLALPMVRNKTGMVAGDRRNMHCCSLLKENGRGDLKGDKPVYICIAQRDLNGKMGHSTTIRMAA